MLAGRWPPMNIVWKVVITVAAFLRGYLDRIVRTRAFHGPIPILPGPSLRHSRRPCRLLSMVQAAPPGALPTCAIS